MSNCILFLNKKIKLFLLFFIIYFFYKPCFATCYEIGDDPENPIKNSAGISKAMDIIKFIPGVGLIIPSFTYMSLVGMLNVSGEAEGLEVAGEALGVVGDIFNPSEKESVSSTALQTVFNTNQYCKQQRIYQEESQYISKQEASPDGGYPIFPIYPMNIEVNENGQCNLSSTIDGDFLSINDPESYSNLNSAGTKCTYSYSATSDQCILELDIPILTLYSAQVPIVESVCKFLRAKKGNVAEIIKSEKKVSKFAKIARKIAEIISDITLIGGINLFLDNRLALDPITFLAKINNENALEIFLSFPFEMATLDLSCSLARIIAVQTIYYASLSIIAGISNSKYTTSKESIINYTFCGYDWLSYKKTEDGKYWARGPYCQVSSDSDDYNDKCNSYYRTVINAVEKGNIPKNIKEEMFREYTYGGKEYDSGIPEYVVSNENLSIEYDINYCIDPRTPEQKGFDTLGQRYYMRGNDKANFACNRFFYDGVSECFTTENNITENEKNNNNKKEYNIKYFDKEKKKNSNKNINYYLINDAEKCKKTFEKARECCEYRSKHLVCLEKKNRNLHKKGEYTFCFSHVFDKYQDIPSNFLNFFLNRKSEKYGPTCELDDVKFEPAKKIKTDYVCVYSYGLCPYDFKLNAGLNYRASYCDTNYFSNYADRSDILQREATHFNKITCEQGLFSENMREKYKSLFGGTSGREIASYTYEKVRKDMRCFNSGDFERIYNFDLKDENDKYVDIYEKFGVEKDSVKSGFKEVIIDFDDTKSKVMYNLDQINVARFKSSAFGQVKNFCQYRAHCVEVEREQEYNDNYVTGSLFFDSSCSGKTSNSRNILQGDTGIIFRQFSAPIAECIFESLKNLINGVAGNSLCENGEPTNSSGYCGTDNEKTVKVQYENGNKAFFKNRYQAIDGKFIVKGYSLPESYNPFIKMQKYFINVIKAALALFLAIYFYKKLLLGDLENFTKPENISKLVFTAFKFAVVIWLIFYNGWQDGVYNHLVNFATASYSFVNNIFVKSVKNPKNQILDLDRNNIIRISEKDFEGKNLPALLCYRYDAFGNISYSRRDIEVDGVIRRCEKGFNSLYIPNTDLEKAAEIKIKRKNYKGQNIGEGLVISNNQEISQLIWFVEDYNKNNSSKLYIEIKTGDSWSDVEESDLWNKNYDGCYFDSTEYVEGKNYLAPFDTLDCKLIRYIGYSTNNAAPSLILYSLIMLVPNFLFPDGKITEIINSLGSVVFGLMMTFMFVIFNIVIKTLYMFTSAFFTLSVLIFISPIILPLMFFERTKNIFDTWLEYIMETIIKPVLNFSFLVVYVNLMDVILLKNTTFNKHSKNGRGPNLICPKGSSSFICLINGIPGIQQIKVLFSSGIISVLIDVIIVFVFFKMSDQILEDVERIASSIFKSLSDPNKSSPSSFNITSGKNDKGEITDGVSSGIGTAMRVGNQIEAIRHDYINNAPGALFSKANEFMEKADRSRELRQNMSKYGKATNSIEKIDKTAYDLTSELMDKAINSFEIKEGDSKLKKSGKVAGNIAAITGAATVSAGSNVLGLGGFFDAGKDFLNISNKLHLKFNEGDSKLKKSGKVVGNIATLAATAPMFVGDAVIRGAANIGKMIGKAQNLRDNLGNRASTFINRKKRMFSLGVKNAWRTISFKNFRDDSASALMLEENVKLIDAYKKFEEIKKIKSKRDSKKEEYKNLKKRDKGWKFWKGESEETKKAKKELKSLKKKYRKLKLAMPLSAEKKSQKYLENIAYIEKHAGNRTLNKMDEFLSSSDENERNTAFSIFKESQTLLDKRSKRLVKGTKKLLKYDKKLRNICKLKSEIDSKKEEYNRLKDENEDPELIRETKEELNNLRKRLKILKNSKKSIKEKYKKYKKNIKSINKSTSDDDIIEIYENLSDSKTEKSAIIRENIRKRAKKVKTKMYVNNSLKILNKELENGEKVRENLKNNKKYKDCIEFINENASDEDIEEIYDRLSESEEKSARIFLEDIKERTKEVRTKRVNKAIENNLRIIERESENLGNDDKNGEKIKERLRNNKKYNQNIELIKKYADQNSVAKLLNDEQEEAKEDEKNPRRNLKLKDLEIDQNNIPKIKEKSKNLKTILLNSLEHKAEKNIQEPTTKTSTTVLTEVKPITHDNHRDGSNEPDETEIKRIKVNSMPQNKKPIAKLNNKSAPLEVKPATLSTPQKPKLDSKQIAVAKSDNKQVMDDMPVVKPNSKSVSTPDLKLNNKQTVVTKSTPTKPGSK